MQLFLANDDFEDCRAVDESKRFQQMSIFI